MCAYELPLLLCHLGDIFVDCTDHLPVLNGGVSFLLCSVGENAICFAFGYLFRDFGP